MAQPHVELVDVGKRFGGVQALAEVSWRSNAARSTGSSARTAPASRRSARSSPAFTPDEGELRVDGRTVRYRAPRDALADGVTMIAQELSLVPARSVLDNVFLGR